VRKLVRTPPKVSKTDSGHNADACASVQRSQSIVGVRLVLSQPELTSALLRLVCTTSLCPDLLAHVAIVVIDRIHKKCVVFDYYGNMPEAVLPLHSLVGHARPRPWRREATRLRLSQCCGSARGDVVREVVRVRSLHNFTSRTSHNFEMDNKHDVSVIKQKVRAFDAIADWLLAARTAKYGNTGTFTRTAKVAVRTRPNKATNHISLKSETTCQSSHNTFEVALAIAVLLEPSRAVLPRF
jgi:hypothetical protein